ncbi:MAG: hypothetical protein ACRYF3_07570, partial [Janthinobacterium lividum]
MTVEDLIVAGVRPPGDGGEFAGWVQSLIPLTTPAQPLRPHTETLETRLIRLQEELVTAAPYVSTETGRRARRVAFTRFAVARRLFADLPLRGHDPDHNNTDVARNDHEDLIYAFTAAEIAINILTGLAEQGRRQAADAGALAFGDPDLYISDDNEEMGPGFAHVAPGTDIDGVTNQPLLSAEERQDLPRFLRLFPRIAYADAINVASLSNPAGDVDATLTGFVDAAYEVLAGRGERLDGDAQSRTQPGDAYTVHRWIRARLIAAWSHDRFGTPEPAARLVVEWIRAVRRITMVSNLDYHELAGRNASLRSWGSQQSLEDVHILLGDLDSTALAVITWARTVTNGALDRIDAWLQEKNDAWRQGKPDHPRYVNVRDGRADLHLLGGWLARDITVDDYYGTIRDFQVTRRNLSQWMGRRLGPAPAWTAYPDHPHTIAVADATTVINDALAQVDAWLQANPTHRLRTYVTEGRHDFTERRGWFAVVYDQDDIDAVMRSFQRTRRELSRSTSRRWGPAAWAVDPNHRNTIAVTQVTTVIDGVLAQVNLWLQDNPTHPLHTEVTGRRDDLINRRDWLDWVHDRHDIDDVSNSLPESFRSLNRLLGRMLGRRVGPGPWWTADPHHPATIAKTQATTEFNDALAQVDAWLRDTSTHRLRTDVIAGRAALIERHSWLDIADEGDEIRDVTLSIQETRRQLSRSMGQWLGPAQVWRADPDHPDTIAVTQAKTMIDDALAPVNAWLQDNPDHLDHADVTEGRDDVLTRRDWLVVAETPGDIKGAIDSLPALFRSLGLLLGWRVGPVPVWRADPDHPDTIAVTQATTAIEDVLAQLKVWFQDNPGHPDRLALTEHRDDLIELRVWLIVAGTSNHIEDITSGYLPEPLSAVLGRIGHEPLAWYDAVQAPLNGLTPQEWLTALGAATTRMFVHRQLHRENARTRASAAVTAVIRARDDAAVSQGRAVPPVLAEGTLAAVSDTLAWNLIADPSLFVTRAMTLRDRVFVDSLLDDSDVALRETQRPPGDAPSIADVEDDEDSDGDDGGDSDGGGDGDGDSDGDGDGDSDGDSGGDSDGDSGGDGGGDSDGDASGDSDG